MTDLEQIQGFFERHCARLPDPVGMRVYAEHRAAGMSLQALEAAIASSEEARRVTTWRRITGKVAPENEEERRKLSAFVLSTPLDAPAPELLAPAMQISLPPPTPTPHAAAAAEMPDSEVFLTSVFLAILGRRPDEIGLKAYQDAIANGLPLLQVVKDVMASDEARKLNGHSRALDREQQLRGWARLPTLRRLCTGLANAVVAQEYLRLWNKRMPRAPR